MTDYVLQNAWRLHQAGNFAEAARLYNEVLRVNPRHPGALQMLGFLHFQRGDLAEAERIMQKAVKLDPASAEAAYNHGCALQALGRDKDALAAFDRVLALKPDYAPAQHNRGNVLSKLGRFADALRSYDLALALIPGSAEVLMNRGNALFELGRHAEALASYDAALAKEPRQAILWNNRGNALAALERHHDALASFTRALGLEPGYADALANRADVLVKLGREDEALADFNKALALEPDNIDALHSRGRLLKARGRAVDALAAFDRVLALSPTRLEAAIDRGVVLITLKRHDEALAAFDRVLERTPNSVEALSNRASVLLRLKQYDAALAGADRAIGIDPTYAAAWHNRGSALTRLKRPAEALAAYDKALALAPDNATTWSNRAGAMVALKQTEAALPYFDTALKLNSADPDIWNDRAHACSALKRFPEAIANAEKALSLDPDHPRALWAMVHSRLHICDWSRRADDQAKISAALAAGALVIDPLDHRGFCDSEAEHLIAARLWMTNECPQQTPLWRGERYAHDKIRLAYISTDFRAHAVASLIVGVFEHHDKARFETTAISLRPDDGSETRARIQSAFDRFIDVQAMDDAAVAAMLRDMEIDIAIDLNAYTGDPPRTGILSQRPAPVQVNYLGYPGTMAAPFIDYIIADRWVIPEANRIHYTEQVVYLPDAYQANDRKRRIGDTPTRAEAGLPERGFVFSSFNNNYKISPEIFAIWIRLLRDVEGSVLWLLEDNPFAASNLRREVEARGIAAERLIFAPRKKPHEHLARQRLADLFLDTLPYNAHTTASDALWMGLPIVTCPGGTFPGRVAASLLHAIGMPELVTASLAEYETLAIKLACEPASLASIKAKLAAHRDTEPMFNTPRFARYLETAYATMWERQQRGEPPVSFAVPRINGP